MFFLVFSGLILGCKLDAPLSSPTSYPFPSFPASFSFSHRLLHGVAVAISALVAVISGLTLLAELMHCEISGFSSVFLSVSASFGCKT